MSRVRLHRRLALEAEALTADGAGGFVRAWVARGYVWGEVTPRTGPSVAGEEVHLSRQAYRITVRGAAPGEPSRPVAGERFRDGSRTFAILAVTESDPSGRYLVCAAREEEPA